MFINKAKNIHKNNFNYELVQYINSKTKIKIQCNTCSFRALRFLNGSALNNDNDNDNDNDNYFLIEYQGKQHYSLIL
jgi:hypothetical protein